MDACLRGLYNGPAGGNWQVMARHYINNITTKLIILGYEVNILISLSQNRRELHVSVYQTVIEPFSDQTPPETECIDMCIIHAQTHR